MRKDSTNMIKMTMTQDHSFCRDGLVEDWGTILISCFMEIKKQVVVVVVVVVEKDDC